MELFGQRNAVPVENRLAHIDRDQPVLVFLGIEDTGDGLEGEGLLAGFGGQRLHDAARAVTAGLRAGSVAVEISI